jgi:proline iminopeptidase
LALVGDDLLPEAHAQATHHIDIDAPPASVWPWLVQMGRGRGGWYSWDFLDNHGQRSADRIVPELQTLAVGDRLRMNATGSVAVAVLVLDPSRGLVLGDPSLLPNAPPSTPGAPRATWAFSLEPIGDACTRLVVRVRADYEPGFTAEWVRRIVTVLHDVMERKQLHTLKKRIEGVGCERRAS